MADFVLVHGAWHGAWCWKRVLPGLWRAGHRAFAVTLAGVGERAHECHPGITLATHVQDVVAVLEAEELQGCILVGHSYAGMVVTGAADRCPGRIGRLVYLDAKVPRSGEAWGTGHTEAVRAERLARIAEKGWLPPPDPAIFGLAGADRDWVARRLTPQPGGVYLDSLVFDEARWRALPRTFIACTDPALSTLAASRARVHAEGGWTVAEIPTGHDPMISAPDRLQTILLAGA